MGNDATARATTSTTAATGKPAIDAGAGNASAPDSAPMAMLRAKVAQGAGPADVAPIVAANPGQRGELIAYLQTTRGNAFVQQVVLAGGAGSVGGGSGNAGGPANAPNGPGTGVGPVLADGPQKNADLGSPPPPPPPQKDPLVGGADMIAFVVRVDDQFVQVYVAPGGINHHPNVFMFFHGQRANLMVDPELQKHPKDGDNVSGNDTAGSAMKEAKAKNTIAFLPQGVDGVKGGGGMPALENGGLPKFLDDLLAATRDHLGMTGDVKPEHIALAGHSAGGYMGVHEALSTAGAYADTISDITLMDTNYSTKHFEDASKWLFSGKPGKTLRIVQGQDQTKHSHEKVDDPANPGQKIDKPIDPYWRDSLGEQQLKADADKAGMTIEKVVSPTKENYDGTFSADRARGNKTFVFQHTRVLNAKGELQCDVLVMMSLIEHHEVRDNVMDDAIDSIGKGGADSDSFGKNSLKDYGRDKDMPHHGNAEGPFSDAELAEQAAERSAARAAERKKKQQQQPQSK